MAGSGLPGALEGVRVVEFATTVAIPVCGLLLADMGADVIKVEPREGEPLRHNASAIVPGESKGFIVFNRGKRSMCLDLARPESGAVVERLVRWADIVLVSMKLPDLPRYGLEYERLAALNPRLVYLEHAPMGTKGPLADQGGYDVVVQGMSGVSAITGRNEGPAPGWVRPAYADMATGFLSTLAVVAALRHRDLTGEGQRVGTSLLGSAVTLGGPMLHWFAATDPPVWEALEADLSALRAKGADYETQRAAYFDRAVPSAYGNIYFRHYRTADGFISIGCLSPALNARFRKVTGIRDPRVEPGWDPWAADATPRLRGLVGEAEALLAGRTTDEWLTVFRNGGVPCARYNFPHEAFGDPQILANEFLVELEHPLVGHYKSFNTPFRMERTPPRIRASSPLLDADTDAVLAELGYTGEEVTALREAGVAGSSAPPATGW